jgi:hypothetical protein
MPGVKSRLSPPASAALMVAAESPGLATKNWSRPRVVPGVVPDPQEMPEELVRNEGTLTR